MLGKHITICEDSLTASVFTHLLHLPVEMFWKVLQNACYSTVPNFSGQLLQMDPRPRREGRGTETNSRYVEPDVFIRFSNFDLIVEAKFKDEGQQSEIQWRKELIAYRNVYGEENRPVGMLALGGIWDKADREMIAPAIEDRPELRCLVHMCKWERLLAECQRAHKELRMLVYPNSTTEAHMRVLDDLIKLFLCHGYQTGIWFADVAAHIAFVTPPLLPHLQTLNKIHSRL